MSKSKSDQKSHLPTVTLEKLREQAKGCNDVSPILAALKSVLEIAETVRPDSKKTKLIESINLAGWKVRQHESRLFAQGLLAMDYHLRADASKPRNLNEEERNKLILGLYFNGKTRTEILKRTREFVAEQGSSTPDDDVTEDVILGVIKRRKKRLRRHEAILKSTSSPELK